MGRREREGGGWVGGYSSVVEHSTADREVPGSSPGAPSLALHGITFCYLTYTYHSPPSFLLPTSRLGSLPCRRLSLPYYASKEAGCVMTREEGCIILLSPPCQCVCVPTVRKAGNECTLRCSARGAAGESWSDESSGCVAQWITRLTTDQKIPGSNPGALVWHACVFFSTTYHRPRPCHPPPSSHCLPPSPRLHSMRLCLHEWHTLHIQPHALQHKLATNPSISRHVGAKTHTNACSREAGRPNYHHLCRLQLVRRQIGGGNTHTSHHRHANHHTPPERPPTTVRLATPIPCPGGEERHTNWSTWASIPVPLAC